MSPLTAITGTEAHALWNLAFRGLGQVNDELTELERCPSGTRALLYGPRALEAMQGVRDDMVDLLCDAADVLSTTAT